MSNFRRRQVWGAGYCNRFFIAWCVCQSVSRHPLGIPGAQETLGGPVFPLIQCGQITVASCLMTYREHSRLWWHRVMSQVSVLSVWWCQQVWSGENERLALWNNWSLLSSWQDTKVMWQRLHQMTPTRWSRVDRQTQHTSVTIVCISCPWCSLKMKSISVLNRDAEQNLEMLFIWHIRQLC